MDGLRFFVWKVWNRARWYWPQAQSRRRTIEQIKTAYHLDNLGPYKPRRPWWWPT